jgi:DNA-binding transcriptional LysR family regulator
MNYDLKDLKLLLQVAEHGSLRKAAEKSDLSVASASARIAKLESALGVELFSRQARGMQLTRAGKIALHNVQKVFLILQEMDREASGPIRNKQRATRRLGAEAVQGAGRAAQ